MLVVLLIAIAFGGKSFSLKWKRHFAPKHEDVRREVFQATRSYNESKKQDLIKYMYQYYKADDENDKKAIAFAVRHAFAEYDENKLTEELSNFLREIKYGGR